MNTDDEFVFVFPAFSNELEQILCADSDWVEMLSKWSNLETIMRDHFQDATFSSTSTRRMGTAKTSFTYLLLDPRISNNLPARCENIDLMEVWRTFVRSIFYIGKGTRARPYEHLHEAFVIWHETKVDLQRPCNAKVNQEKRLSLCVYHLLIIIFHRFRLVSFWKYGRKD